MKNSQKRLKTKKKRILYHKNGYNKFYLITHPWKIIQHFCKEIKYFIQRGLYGYSNFSVYSLDSYLSEWLPNAVRELKDKCGYPCGLTKKKWISILEKIALGFEAHPILQFENIDLKERKRLRKQYDEGMKLFAEYFGHLWY